jgi:hypothetical protein
MRFQECPSRSIVVSVAKDEVSRMYCNVNCGFHDQRWGCKNVLQINCSFHNQKWGYKNVLQNQLWFPRSMMKFQECTTRSIGEFWGLKNNFPIRVPRTYFNST